MEKPGITGDNRPRPVGGRWTTPCTACGASSGPQAVEIVRPPIHKRLSWPDRSWTAQPVDAIWTTPRSPGCGCKKVAGSVESDRNPADIRTAGVVGAAHGGPDRSGRSRLPGPEQASRPRGARPRGLVTASPTASPATTASGRPSAKPTAVRPSADRPQAILDRHGPGTCIAADIRSSHVRGGLLSPVRSVWAAPSGGRTRSDGVHTLWALRAPPGAAVSVARRPRPGRASPTGSGRRAGDGTDPHLAARSGGRNTKGARRTSSRGARSGARPARRARQPFLMRLVSSVTWL